MIVRARNKYGAKKVELDGFRFDSQREAARYGELKLLEKAGKIHEIVVHPGWLLQKAFTHPLNGRVRAIHYIADFSYVETILGPEVVEDVKGVKTELYKLKRKLFLYRHPEIEFREVT